MTTMPYSTRFVAPRILLPDDLVTPHFRLREFARDDDPWPAHDPVGYERLMRLAAVLEACRARVGRPIRILSGWRSPEHNAATPGAAKKSQHCLALAADIRPLNPAGVDASNADAGNLHAWLTANHAALGVHGVGWYSANERQPRARIHVDLRPGPHLAQWRKMA